MNNSSLAPLDVLEQIEDPAHLKTFLAGHPHLHIGTLAEQLHAAIVAEIVVSPDRARRLANLVRWIAEISQDDYTVGLADRCEGHVQYAASEYSAAMRCYEAAVKRFERSGRDLDVARTL